MFDYAKPMYDNNMTCTQSLTLTRSLSLSLPPSFPPSLPLSLCYILVCVCACARVCLCVCVALALALALTRLSCEPEKNQYAPRSHTGKKTNLAVQFRSKNGQMVVRR